MTPHSPSETYASLSGEASLAHLLSAPSNINATITITFSSSVTDAACFADSFQVANGYTPVFDSDAAGGSGSNTTTVNTPTITPTTSNELFYAAVEPGPAITAVGNSWVLSPTRSYRTT